MCHSIEKFTLYFIINQNYIRTLSGNTPLSLWQLPKIESMQTIVPPCLKVGITFFTPPNCLKETQVLQNIVNYSQTMDNINGTVTTYEQLEDVGSFKNSATNSASSIFTESGATVSHLFGLISISPCQEWNSTNNPLAVPNQNQDDIFPALKKGSRDW